MIVCNGRSWRARTWAPCPVQHCNGSTVSSLLGHHPASPQTGACTAAWVQEWGSRWWWVSVWELGRRGENSGSSQSCASKLFAVDTAKLETGPNTHLINMFQIRGSFWVWKVLTVPSPLPNVFPRPSDVTALIGLGVEGLAHAKVNMDCSHITAQSACG